MVTQQLRKVGNSVVVTIPKSELERLELGEGDYVQMEVTKLELKPIVNPEVQANIDRNREGLTAIMNYLKDK